MVKTNCFHNKSYIYIVCNLLTQDQEQAFSVMSLFLYNFAYML